MNAKSLICIIFAGLTWGASPLFVEWLSAYGFTPLQMTAARGASALICTLIYTLIVGVRHLRAKPRHLLLFLASGAALYLSGAFYYLAINYVSGATAATLLYIAPAVVTVVSVIFLGERISPLKIVAVAMMPVGAALVSGVVGGFDLDPLGIIFGLLAGLTYSAYVVVTKIEMRVGADPHSASLYNLVVFSLIAIPVCRPLGIFEHAQDLTAWLLLCGIGVVTCAIPFFLYTVALRTIPAGVASSLAVIEPLSATVYSMAFLGRFPDVFTWIGMAVILSAVVMLGIAEHLGDRGRAKISAEKENGENK